MAGDQHRGAEAEQVMSEDHSRRWTFLIALYFQVMNIKPEEPRWPERDRFILSKGHSSIGL